MCINLLRIIQILIVINYFLTDTFAQNKRYDFENWPGKNGVIKSNIELTHQFISKHDLSLATGSKGNYFFYKVSLDENDTIKNGRLQLHVFSNVEEAQLALVDYLDKLTTPNKPPRLTNEDFKAGDVAFGEKNDGILWMVFTRNNVTIIVHAPTKKAIAIAHEIDNKIINAPEWEKDTSKPSFILTE